MGCIVSARSPRRHRYERFRPDRTRPTYCRRMDALTQSFGLFFVTGLVASFLQALYFRELARHSTAITPDAELADQFMSDLRRMPRRNAEEVGRRMRALVTRQSATGLEIRRSLALISVIAALLAFIRLLVFLTFRV